MQEEVKLCPFNELRAVCFDHFKLKVVYEGNDSRVPHKFIRVACVAIAAPESQQFLMPNSL